MCHKTGWREKISHQNRKLIYRKGISEDLLINSLDIYVLRAYYVLVTLPVPRDTKENKQDVIPILLEPRIGFTY